MEGDENRQKLRDNRSFNLYLSRVAFTSLAFSLYSIFIPIFAYTYSGNLIFTGLVLFAQYGVYSLSFLAGPIVDRVRNKRIIFVMSYSTIAALWAFMAEMVHLKSLSPEILIGVVIAIAFADNFAWTTGHIILPMLVNKSDFFKANGYVRLISGSHEVGGLALAGVILIYPGDVYSILLYSAAMWCAAFISLHIPLYTGNRESEGNEGLAEGWKYLARNYKPMILTAIYLSLISFFGLAPALLILNGTSGSFWYIVLYAAFMVGGIIAGPLLGILNMRKRVGLGIVTSAMSYAFLIMASSYLFAVPIFEIPVWMVAGISLDTCITLFNVYLQGTVKREFLGRSASSLYTFRKYQYQLGA
ncbi:MFS transporter [Oxyplasma meridianum]|uniref:MFS transporter n=1 Tax=Oxyplasma meridianum TaxID=3073602 RepID=A0AAX4NJ10_9ARCH